MVLALVEKIIVHENSRLEIIFKYEDEYKTACRIVEKYAETAEREVCTIG